MRDTIDFSGKQWKNLTVTATPNQQFNFLKSDDDTAILSPNCLAYHRKITAPWKFFFLSNFSTSCSVMRFFAAYIRGVHISFSLFSHQVTCEDRKWSCSFVVIAPIWDGKMELCTFLIAEWVGPFSKKSLGENLTCIAWRDPSFPLLTYRCSKKS